MNERAEIVVLGRSEHGRAFLRSRPTFGVVDFQKCVFRPIDGGKVALDDLFTLARKDGRKLRFQVFDRLFVGQNGGEARKTPLA